MKKLIIVSAAILGAWILTACQPTSNGSSSTVAAQTCTINSLGQSVNQYGQPCTPTTTQACTNFNPSTGTWTNAQGMPCSQGGLPGGGTGFPGAGGGGTNCQAYNNYYQSIGYMVQYIPMYSNNQWWCIDVSGYGSQFSNLYTNQIPVYASTCPYGDPYSCSQWSGYGSGGGGSGMCMGIGFDAGIDYGISGFFGVCQ